MRRLPLLVAASLVVGAFVATPTSLAVFARSRATTGDFATGSILPPASLAANVSGTVVTLTWTPSTSSNATGYDVLRSSTSGSGYGSIGSVTPISASTTANSPGNGTWYYVLRSVLQNWHSANSNEASASLGGTNTGFKSCANNQADTGGDNNGYETNPGNGCAQDGALATDANSGTSSSTSCTDAGKDRHRFWGYAFGLPGTVSSINGISVQVRAGVNNNGGTSLVCAQLSWDGGTTWTTTQSSSVGNSQTTLTLGGTTSLWGRTWNRGELDTTSFRVRVIDASSMSNKDFMLDSVQVQASYTP